MPIHVALTLSLVESVALAGVLLAWADRVAGARLLVAFLLGVAVWTAGNELPVWTGPVADRPALMLLGTAAVTSAAFLHFTLRFCGLHPPRAVLAAAYGVALAATLAAAVEPAGRFDRVTGLGPIALPNAVGWATTCVWAGLAALGQFVLLRGFVRARGLDRRRIAVVMAASAWGLACMSGYGIVVLDLPFYPWPLLGLPLYPVILVYGILRYRVLVANAWARRAVTWTLLVTAAGLSAGAAGALAPHLPFGDAGWASGAVAAAAVLVLGGPARRLAERIVYPGRVVSAEDLRGWRAALAGHDTLPALCGAAADLLSRHLAMPVTVRVGEAEAGRDPGAPALDCRRAEGGAWRCRLSGWDAAPPGPRRLAGFFADLLSTEAARVDGLEAVREREREGQHRARLAELGAIAGAVAHDLRNPLNNIGMAVALAPPALRDDVGAELARIARLADDLLDYAKPWRVEGVALDLSTCAAGLRARWPGVELGAGTARPVIALADPGRLDRALGNLLDNAVATGGRFGIDAENRDGRAWLHVFDDGPGIPEEIRGRLFQPFVSRRPGGTGLGLAIVAQILEAHGGSVGLTDRPGWTTCFSLALPLPAEVAG